MLKIQESKTKHQEQLDEIARLAYYRGYLHGLEAYAWWQDGIQRVGACGTTLEAAKMQAKQTYNYNP